MKQCKHKMNVYINQKNLNIYFEMLKKKKAVLFQYRLSGALGEVVKVHPEFKRMMNAVFLSLLGDTMMMRHINLYYHSTTRSRTSKGNRNIALTESICLHTPAHSFYLRGVYFKILGCVCLCTLSSFCYSLLKND